MNPELKPLNFRSFFSDLIIHPEHAVKDDRDWTWAATIILGIFTLGLVHAGYLIAEKCFTQKDNNENSQISKTDDVAKKVNLGGNETGVFSNEDESIEEETRFQTTEKINKENLEKVQNSELFFLDAASTPKPSFSNVNKEYVYDQLTEEHPVDDQIAVHYCTLNKGWINNQPVFSNIEFVVDTRHGGFSFDASTESEEHWTADFADNSLLGFCKGGLLAQEELLCTEHPGLTHLHAAILKEPHFRYLDDFDNPEGGEHRIALIEGAKRRGELKMYGNAFASAPQEEVEKKLIRLEPQESFIFAMAAPAPNFDNTGKPYQKQDIEIFIYRAFNAFYHLKGRSQERHKNACIHTGNWGCGAFGGSPTLAALAQLATAESAGVNHVIYYPRSSPGAFHAARAILQAIREKSPDITIGELIQHLAKNAKSYQLIYGVSNGT